MAPPAAAAAAAAAGASAAPIDLLAMLLATRSVARGNMQVSRIGGDADVDGLLAACTAIALRRYGGDA